MSETILLVDDEPAVLRVCKAQLDPRFAVATAEGGAAGLAALAAAGPFAVVVSDLRMPGMGGVEFLARARALAPDAVRVLLTGYADVPSAINAVNDGHVFRFLTKPCPRESLTKALDAALAQYRLVAAERELLEQTLRGCVKVLGEVLALASPLAFGRAARVAGLVRELAAAVGCAGWAAEVAAHLSQVGCVAVPESVLARAQAGRGLGPRAARMLAAHPLVGRDLLRSIPRLAGVAEVVAYQAKRFDGAGPPDLPKAGADIPAEARVLKAALDYDELVGRDIPPAVAVGQMKARVGWYDPAVMAALEVLVGRGSEAEARDIGVGELAPGMVLAADVSGRAGRVLLRRGSAITAPLIRRLESLTAAGEVSPPVAVLVPPAGG